MAKARTRGVIADANPAKAVVFGRRTRDVRRIGLIKSWASQAIPRAVFDKGGSDGQLRSIISRI